MYPYSAPKSVECQIALFAHFSLNAAVILDVRGLPWDIRAGGEPNDELEQSKP